MLALRNARLIDGTGAPPRNDVTVTLDDGRINQISETGQIQVSAGASVIDLQGRTLLPGLIDAHVHLSSLGLPQLTAAFQDVPPDLHAYGLALVSRAMLEGGITTVRDAGSYGRSLFALRQALGLELCIGPRLVLCGQIVAATSPGGRLFTGCTGKPMVRMNCAKPFASRSARERISSK
jgi:imidazolonepropionase-like amidohydrolase